MRTRHPDEAWHILLDLGRTVCSRGWKALQADFSRTLRRVAMPAKTKCRKLNPAPPEDDGDNVEPSAAEMSLSQKLPVERYCERFSGKLLGKGVTVEWLEDCCLARFVAEVDERGCYLHRRQKPRVVKTKPYLNLDMSSGHGPRMARMALRLYRPFENLEQDPADIVKDEEAIGQLEVFLGSTQCPRWLQARYREHNRVRLRRCSNGGEVSGAEGDASRKRQRAESIDAVEQETREEVLDQLPDIAEDSAMPVEETGVARDIRSEVVVAAAHGLRWDTENTYPDQPFSVTDSFSRAGRKVPVPYLKAIVEALGHPVSSSPKRLARMRAMVRCILDLDLEAFVPKGRGVVKPSLSSTGLRDAARLWRKYHPMARKEDLNSLRENLPYPVLWQNLKRLALGECGLCVIQAPSRRVYFEAPFRREHLAPAEHASVKEGKWREPVRISTPYAPDAEDFDMASDRQSARLYVRSAAFEHAMGRGGEPEDEVPIAFDNEALDCPDRVTKAEWDAMWPFEDLVRPQPLPCEDPQVCDILEGDERLAWVTPAREGGLTDSAFAKVVQNSAPVQESENIPSIDALDPTQRSFTEMGLDWFAGRRPHFRAILLGTAGTGKTTTLKVLLRELKNRGLQKADFLCAMLYNPARYVHGLKIGRNKHSSAIVCRGRDGILTKFLDWVIVLEHCR